MSNVVVIGDALIDELQDDGGVREFVGGAALNVAVGLRVLGVPTTLLAMLGDDEPGRRIRTYLDTFAVDVLHTHAPRGTGRAVSVRRGGAEPEYAFNETSHAPVVAFGDAELAAVAAAPAVVISGVSLGDPTQVDALLDVLSPGSTVVIDPNPRAARLGDPAAFRAGLLALAARASLVKIGEEDAALLGWESTSAAARELRELGVPAVLTTLGEHGAGIVAEGIQVSAPIAAHPGPIVDTMGAGDATLAAVVAALLQEAPATAAAWEAVLARAMGVAAATCRFEGALLRVPRADDDPIDRIGT